MNTELAKAIFEAGFRAGYNSGHDHAVALEWGSYSREPDSGHEAWVAYVQPCLDPTNYSPLNMDDVNSWENIP